MANLTISVDGETLKRARMRALEEGESVNKYLARQLRLYADKNEKVSESNEAALKFINLSKAHEGTSHGEGWRREELYENIS